jgi:hypothetical protein
MRGVKSIIGIAAPGVPPQPRYLGKVLIIDQNDVTGF